MSNLGAATAAAVDGDEVNGKAEMESAAAAVSASEGTTKCKKKKKRKQEEANAKESVTVEQEAASVAVAVLGMGVAPAAAMNGEEMNGKAEMESAAAAVSVSEGTTKCKKKKKRKQEEANDKESVTVEQEAASAAVAVLALEEGTPKPKKKKKKKPKDQEMVEQEATTAVVSAVEEGTPKCKEEEEKTEESPKCKKRKEEKAEEGTPKCKKREEDKTEETPKCKKRKEDKAEEGTPKCKKREEEKTEETTKHKKRKEEKAEDGTPKCEKRKEEKAEEGTPKCKKRKEEKAKEIGTLEQGATSAAVLELEGTPKCKKKDKLKGRGIAEQDPTTPTFSALEGTPKCKKVKERGITEQEGTTATVSALEGTIKCKKKKKERVSEARMDELEASTAVSVLEGTQKHENTEEGNETGLAKQETTTSVSASESSPKHKKLKKKNKMQEQHESPQALSSHVVDKIMVNKPGNDCKIREWACGAADVSMDPVNEDPNCSQVKDTNEKMKFNAGKGNENCSENCSSLPEISEDRKKPRKKPRRKRKQDASSTGPAIFSEDGDMVVKRCLDSSADHDLNCMCSLCLVRVQKESVKNIYSPRGSLVRFQRKKLLILDLNGLLADINTDYQNAHMAHAKVKAKLVFRRPYCDDFLRFCFQNFELGIWSSRNKDNVNSVVNILMRDLKQYLLFCWDMSHCTVTGCNTVENKHKPLVLKELKKLWNKEDPNLPWEQGEFSPSNTLLVDDSPYKALCNPPHTAIFPQPYSYLNQRGDYSLGPGGDLRVYLERLAAADDVQIFVRDNPFGQPSITKSNRHWNFYSKIVNKVEKSSS